MMVIVESFPRALVRLKKAHSIVKTSERRKRKIFMTLALRDAAIMERTRLERLTVVKCGAERVKQFHVLVAAMVRLLRI